MTAPSLCTYVFSRPPHPSGLPALQVLSMFLDCDRDSLIYLAEPIGPACHTNAPTCYFCQADASSGTLRTAGEHSSRSCAPMITLYALERTIAQRRAEADMGMGAWLRRWPGPKHVCKVPCSQGPVPSDRWSIPGGGTLFDGTQPLIH